MENRETLIHTGKYCLVHRLETDGEVFLTKTLKEEVPPLIQQYLLNNELVNTRKQTHQESSRRGLEIRHQEGKTSLLFPYINGKSLRELLDTQDFGLGDGLKLAFQITERLEEIHAAGVVLRNIGPHHILVSGEEKEIHFIDWGAAHTAKSDPKTRIFGMQEGGLLHPAYMAPEQTGRLKAAVDARADLYALGVVFYELFCGTLPFEAENLAGWIHAHLALKPKLIAVSGQKVPAMLEKIVERLLTKDATHRYQTATGLKHDLFLCLQAWENDQQIAPFELGRGDLPGDFQLPGKLYGREEVLDRFTQAFQTAKEGGFTSLFLQGRSGVGKTSVVREAQRRFEQEGCIFLKGKLEQQQQKDPYSALVLALKGFFQQLQTESEESLQHWKSHLQEEMGEEAGILLPLLPELSAVLGLELELPPMEEEEYRLSFRKELIRLIQAIAKKGNPLVLFIDDLQWGEQETMDFLELLLQEKEITQLLLICAFRELEEHPDALLSQILPRWQEELGVKVDKLPNLSELDLAALLKDTFNCGETKSLQLGTIILKKSEGNPFYSAQLIQSLVERKLIWFDVGEQQWKWEIEAIESQTITDNLVGILEQKLENLSPPETKFLNICACLGGKFSLEQIASMEGKTEEELKGWFDRLQQEQFLVEANSPSDLGNGQYAFAHDQLRQIVYEKMSPEEQQLLHHKIGSYFLSHSNDDPRETTPGNIFQLVQHLNLGTPASPSPQERDQLISLNLYAGHKAKESASYRLSHTYFQTSHSLFPEDQEGTNEELWVETCAKLLDSSYLVGEYEQVKELGPDLLSQSSDQTTRIGGYLSMVKAARAQLDYASALDVGLQALKDLGTRLPRKPGILRVLLELIRAKIASPAEKNVLKLAERELLPSKQKEELAQITHLLGSAAYIDAPNLLPILISRGFLAQLKYGNGPMAPLIYSAYGVIELGLWKNISLGFQLGQLALRLLTQDQPKSRIGTTLYTVHGLINPWSVPLTQCIQGLEQAVENCLASGEWENASYAMSFRLNMMKINGSPLSDLMALSEEFQAVVRQHKQQNPLRLMVLEYHYNGRLHGSIQADVPDLPDPAVGEDHPRTYTFYYYYFRVGATYLLGEWEEAFSAVQEAQKYKDAVLANLSQTQFALYEGLVYAKKLAESPTSSPRVLKRRLKQNLAQYRKWSKSSPDSFLFGYHLLKAEWHRVNQQPVQAREGYEAALAQALSESNIQKQVLVQMRLGDFFVERDNQFLASTFLDSAWSACLKWEAYALANHLRSSYPAYLDTKRVVEIGAQSAESAELDPMDTLAVMKASAAISKEVVLDRLLHTVMQTVIEHAGAEKGLLISKEGKKWFIVAMDETSAAADSATLPIPVSQSTLISPKILQYVERTQKTLVMEDARLDPQFGTDSFVQSHQPISFACVPLINQGQVIGLLQLENNQLRGAFTAKRITVLQMLSTQMAISLENASLYANLEQKVADRTVQIEQQKEKIALKNHQNEILLREIHHRVKNNLQVISSLLNLQSDRINDPEVKNAILAGQQRVKSMALIHQNLYQRDNLGHIEMKEYLHTLAESLLRSFRISSEQISLKVEMEELELVIDTAIFVGLIANELITNSLKHAFPNQQSGEISLKMAYPSPGRLLLEIADNGVGGQTKSSSEKPSSFGSELIQLLCLQLNGELDIDTSQGRRTRIIFDAPPEM